MFLCLPGRKRSPTDCTICATLLAKKRQANSKYYHCTQHIQFGCVCTFYKRPFYDWFQNKIEFSIIHLWTRSSRDFCSRVLLCCGLFFQGESQLIHLERQTKVYHTLLLFHRLNPPQETHFAAVHPQPLLGLWSTAWSIFMANKCIDQQFNSALSVS